MTPEPARASPSRGSIVWAATVVVAAALVAFVRVPTHLGVKVVEANADSEVVLTASDFRGSDYLWRIWWRARDDMVDVSPTWLLGVALFVGLVVFLVGVLAAYRLALSIPSSSPPREA